MKALLIFLFFILTFNVKAQLVVDRTFKIDETKESVRKFISHNKFDYALFSWTTSTWMRSSDDFYGLIKQFGKWYLVKISSPKYNLINKYQLSIKSQGLKKSELNKIRSELKLDSTFMYSQDEISSLPDECAYEKDGKSYRLYSIIDAATYHLVNFQQKKFTSLSSYAPNDYLKKCYPSAPEFGKLKGLVNTSEGFWKVFKNFNLN